MTKIFKSEWIQKLQHYRFLFLVSFVTLLVIGLTIQTFIGKANDLEVKVIQGQASLTQTETSKELSKHKTYTFKEGQVLEVQPDSAVLLLFNSGRTLTISKASKLEFNRIETFDSEKIYVFLDQQTGEVFNYNEFNGLHRANAAVLSGIEPSLNSRVLGVREVRSHENLIKKMTDCVQSQEKTNQNSIDKCKQKYGIKDLTELDE